MLSFCLMVLTLLGLTACQQIIDRMVADSSFLTERLTPSQTPPAAYPPEQAVVERGGDAKPSMEPASAPTSTAQMAQSFSDSKPPTPASKTPNALMVETKPSVNGSSAVVIRSPVAPAAVAQSAAPATRSATPNRHLATSNQALPEKQAVRSPADAKDTYRRTDAVQRATSNQVILRDGDVNFDFSNDMPVIKSKNGLDLNEQ
jgi:hypothetical protein